MRTLLLLLASLPLFGQASTPRWYSRADGTPCQSNDLLDSNYKCFPAPPSLEERVAALEKAIAPKGNEWASDRIAYPGVVNRLPVRIGIMVKGEMVWVSLQEANRILVDLAKKINEASANSAMVGDKPKEK